MKTKIIYISGSEVFNITDIRSAFEEVRATLALAPDTVLFGVPVDADDAGLAIDTPTDTTTPEIAPAPVTQPEPEIIPEPVTVVDPDSVIDDVIDPDIPPVVPDMDMETTTDVPDITIQEVDPEPAPEPKPRRTRRPRAPRAAKETSAPDTSDMDNAPEEPIAETVVPILSVLAAQSADAIATDTIADIPADDTPIQITSVSVTDIDMDATSDAADVIADMIDDDVPVDASEKTLEELLEEMAPLREDHETPIAATPIDTTPDTPVIESAPLDLDDTDATLTQLANEFAENEDKIVTEPAPDGRGKIGKLKNILPFKKAKREDPGIMGDLFGWAGIAANDDEFSIPGFFTGASSKK